MAIAVIGGLITSTVLSLLVIPVVFLLIDDFSQRIARWFGRAPAPLATRSPSVS
jgi:predicted RND superfamily exporter protein